MVDTGATIPLQVLLVEDSDDDAQMVARVLRKGGLRVSVTRVENEQEMRAQLRSHSWDVVLCDYNLPAFGVSAALALLRQYGIDVPFIIVSGTVGEETAVGALKAGAHDFIIKGRFARLVPAIQRELAEAENRARRRAAELQLAHSHADLERAYESTLEGWARALELRDAETQGHSERVTALTLSIGRLAGFTGRDVDNLRRGALLHDIGKMGVPDSVLLKPGPLTAAEWDLMRRHPLHAYQMLSAIEFLRPALDIPLSHHERWDGSGYPHGLKQDEIPIAARIFAVVDVWDALCSPRPYKPAWPEDQVFAHIKGLAGSHFDPDVLPLFESAIAARKAA